MRLASLYGPDAIAQAPRAPRFATESEVRVVVGLQALTRAVAEIDRLPDQARTPGIAASYDEVTQIVNPNANPESVARRDPRRDVAAHRSQRDRLPAHGTGQGGAGQAGRAHRDQGRRAVDAGRRAPDAAAAGRRGDRGRGDHRPAAGARADAQLGHAVRHRPHQRGASVLRHLPAGASGQPAVVAAQPDRPRGQVLDRRHGRARHRQRPLSHPVHADARAAGRVGAGRCSTPCASCPAERSGLLLVRPPAPVCCRLANSVTLAR